MKRLTPFFIDPKRAADCRKSVSGMYWQDPEKRANSPEVLEALEKFVLCFSKS